MKKILLGFGLTLLFYISSVGQETDIKKLFKDNQLKQLDRNILRETDFIEKANGKTVLLTSFVDGCKWILEEMAFFNKLKTLHPGEFEVLISFTDDIKTMSDYIQDVQFDFLYIYDPDRLLIKKLDMNDTIYSVLFDADGNILDKTNSGKLNRGKILSQLSKNQTKTNTKLSSTLPVFNCQLKRYEIGDEVSINLSGVKLPVKLLTGYKANDFVDTLESIRFCNITGENILGLYSHAYDLPKTRFVYDKEIEYINSHAPNHRYSLSFSVSDLHADFNQMLIKQIDLNFGLETSTITNETEILILSKVDTGKGKIQIQNTLEESKTAKSTINENDFLLQASNIGISEIARQIEEATHLPVEINVDTKVLYTVDISVENKDKSIESFIRLLAENGLIVNKGKKEVNLIEIKRADK